MGVSLANLVKGGISVITLQSCRRTESPLQKVKVCIPLESRQVGVSHFYNVAYVRKESNVFTLQVFHLQQKWQWILHCMLLFYSHNIIKVGIWQKVKTHHQGDLSMHSLRLDTQKDDKGDLLFFFCQVGSLNMSSIDGLHTTVTFHQN